jgi:hypothetical protein
MAVSPSPSRVRWEAMHIDRADPELRLKRDMTAMGLTLLKAHDGSFTIIGPNFRDFNRVGLTLEEAEMAVWQYKAAMRRCDRGGL